MSITMIIVLSFFGYFVGFFLTLVAGACYQKHPRHVKIFEAIDVRESVWHFLWPFAWIAIAVALFYLGLVNIADFIAEMVYSKK